MDTILCITVYMFLLLGYTPVNKVSSGSEVVVDFQSGIKVHTYATMATALI